MQDIEFLILQYLLHNAEYFEVVINYIDPKLFHSKPHQIISKIIKKFFISESKSIPYDLLPIKLQNLENLSESDLLLCLKLAEMLRSRPDNPDATGLIKETENYFRKQTIANVLANGIEEFDRTKTFTGEFIETAEKAIVYSFDDVIGYNYIKNFDKRLELYKENIKKIPTSISKINDLTNGGIQTKTINAVMASTNGGKSIWLCQEAAFNLQQGKNVLYVTLEMSEEDIAKRIDANLMNFDQNKLKDLSFESARLRFNNAIQKTQGNLIIKEFPAASATCLDIKALLNKIKRKDRIKIDVLIVDYVGILNSYKYDTRNNRRDIVLESVVVELRSLAVQYDIPIWTAMQFNRGAENKEELDNIGLGQTGSSYGMPQNMDFVFSIMHTDELVSQKRAIFNILKSRYGERKALGTCFTVLQKNELGRFEDDPNSISVNLKNESKTKSAKIVEEKVYKSESGINSNNSKNNDIMYLL